MTKPKSIKDELKKQEDEVYGDQTISGTNPDPSSDDDIEEVVEDALGEDAGETVWEANEKHNIADEIEEDEKEIAGITPDEDDEESEIKEPEFGMEFDDEEE